MKAFDSQSSASASTNADRLPRFHSKMDDEPLQGKFTSPGSQPEKQNPQQTDSHSRENRTGMPDQLKSGLESLSGFDLSEVRVNYNSSKPAQINAHAYAQGQTIELGPGQEKHLPHEGWHVVQQMQGRVKPTVQKPGKINVNDDAGLEKEADFMSVISTKNIQTDGSLNEQVTQLETSNNNHELGIIQRTDDDHTTLGANPALWTSDERKEVKKNMYSKLRVAKERALEIAKAYAKAQGAPATVQNISLGDFEITQRGQTGYGRIPVERVYTQKQRIS